MNIKLQHQIARRIMLVLFLLLLSLSAQISVSQPQRDTLAPFWGKTISPYANDITFLKCDSNNILYMGMWGGGMRRSGNEGVSWTVMNTGLTNLYITSFDKDSVGNYFAGTYGSGVFKSGNNGLSWTQVINGLTNLKVKTIAIKKGGPIFVGTLGGGIYRSNNGGNSWQQINNGIWFWDINILMVNNDGVIIAGTNGDGVYRSDDNGDNWRRSNGGITSNNITSFWVNDIGELYCGTLGGGVNYSVSSGVSWSEFKHNSKIVNVSCVSGYIGQEPVAGLCDYGIWKYDSQIYEDWRKSDQYTYGVNCLVRTRGANLFAGIPNLGLYKSVNGGAKWTACTPSFSIDTTIKPIIAYKNGVVLTSNISGYMFASTDYGASWNSVNLNQKYITALAFDSAGSGFAASIMDSAGARYGCLFRTDDNGSTWTRLLRMKDSTIGAIGAKANGIMFLGLGFPPADPKNPSSPISVLMKTTNYALTWSFIQAKASFNGFRFIKINSAGQVFTNFQQGLMRSANDGQTWTRVLDSSVTPADMAFNSLGHYFCATDLGVYKTVNGGGTWTFNKLGFLYPFAKSIVITSNDEIYVALSGQASIFRSINQGTSYDSSATFFSRTDVGGLALAPEGMIYMANSEIFRTIEPYNLVPPVLTAPADMLGGVSLNPTLSWNSAVIADMYEIQLSKEIDFSNILESITLGANSFTVTRGLDYNSMYFWRARSRFNNSLSDWSPNREFFTIIKYPTLVSPANNSSAIPVTMNCTWKKVDGAGGYTIQVSKDPSFGTNIVSKDVTDTTFKVMNLELYTKYFWRVQATASKTRSDWSEVWNFTTKLKPPTLKSPANKTYGIDTIATLQWNPVPGATGYEVQIAKDSLFKQMIFEGETENIDAHRTKLLEYFTKYFWRLRAKDDFGISDWSEYWSFITTIQAPVVLKPYDNSADLRIDSVLFEWASNPIAQKYHLQVSKDVNFSSSIFDDSTITPVSQLLKTFEYFTDYYWHLRMKNGIYNGLWSDTRTFKTGIATPELVSPANNLTDAKKDEIFFWNTVTGADFYQIQVSTDDKFSVKIIDEDSIKIGRYSHDGFPYETKLFWRVKAKYDKGQSFWSEIWNLTIEKKNNDNVIDEMTGLDVNIYPNPFSSFVKFDMKILKNSNVTISILTTNGDEVAKVWSGNLESGSYSFNWTPGDLSQGSYIYKLNVDSRDYFGKLNFVK